MPERRSPLDALHVAWSAAAVISFAVLAPPLSVASPRSVLVVGLGALTAGAFSSLGHRLRRALGRFAPRTDDPLELSVLEFGLGTAAAMAALAALGLLGLFRTWAAWGLLGLFVAGDPRPWLRDLRERLRSSAGVRGHPFLAACLGAVGAMAFLSSLAPPTAQDALVYHLAVPAKYVEAGRICEVPGNFFAHFPQNVEMLFGLALLLGQPSLAGFYHWLLGAAAAAAVAQLARAVRPGSSALFAAVAFATVPTAALIAGWPYVDLGVVFYCVASTACFVRWLSRRELPWLLFAAAFAGVAAGCKYTAGFQGILLVAAVAADARRDGLRACALRSAAVCGVVGALAAPWLVRNLVLTGNPVYPFFYEVFGGKSWDAERAHVLRLFLSEWGRGDGLSGTLLLPWRLTVSGRFFSQDGFDGVIGPVFLAGVPILLLGLRLSREYRTVAGFALAWFAFWIATTRQVRFLLPAAACAASLLGAAVPGAIRSRGLRRAAAASFGAAFALDVLIVAVYFAAHSPLAVVLGVESERSYLRREVPGGDYPVFEHIERELPPESHILLGSMGNPGFLVKRRYTADALFENRTLAAVLDESPDPDRILDGFRARGFTHLAFRFDCAFEETKSGFSFEQRRRLAGFLNRHARLLAEAGGTVLYEVGSGIGPLARGGGPEVTPAPAGGGPRGP